MEGEVHSEDFLQGRTPKTSLLFRVICDVLGSVHLLSFFVLFVIEFGFDVSQLEANL